MNRNPRFWIAMTVFQVIFAFAVFAMTRQHYMQQPGRPDTSRPGGIVSAPVSPAAARPTGVSDLLPLFPGDSVVGSPDVLAARADELFAQQRFDEAAEAYRQLLAAGARDAGTYNNLGITLQYLGQSGEALSVLQEGVEVDASYQRIWLTLGFVHGQIGHTEQAREALNTAVRLGPDTDVGKSAAEMLQRLAADRGDG